jgi:hypothetical protein
MLFASRRFRFRLAVDSVDTWLYARSISGPLRTQELAARVKTVPTERYTPQIRLLRLPSRVKRKRRGAGFGLSSRLRSQLRHGRKPLASRST